MGDSLCLCPLETTATMHTLSLTSPMKDSEFRISPPTLTCTPYQHNTTNVLQVIVHMHSKGTCTYKYTHDMVWVNKLILKLKIGVLISEVSVLFISGCPNYNLPTYEQNCNKGSLYLYMCFTIVHIFTLYSME